MSQIYHMQKNAAIPSRPVVSLDPATGEIWKEHISTSSDQVAGAVRAAREAQGAWDQLGIDGRLKILRKFYRQLYLQRTELARLATREAGKPAAEAIVAELITSLDSVKYYLRNGKKILKTHTWRHQNIALKAKRAMLVRRPWGVVGVITPWNYPLMLVVSTIFPALLAGNSVLLKPSEHTTQIALKVGELLHGVGVPENVFQVLPGDGNAGAALLEHHVDRMVFTGSARAGRSVALAAAEKFIPVTLELGGSDPMIVLKDAALERAAAAAIWGRLINAGQTCVAIKRVFVEAAVYEAFLNIVLKGIKNVRIGRGENPENELGPMIRLSQIEILEEQLQDAINKGAKVLFGGRRRPELGPQFFEPAILSDVTSDMRVMQEETFGPLLPIVPVADAEEAVRLANATPYGLSASIWTKDVGRAQKLAFQIHAGSVTINDVAFYAGAADVPYGGFKNSGIGKNHGEAGLLDMVREQYIDIEPFAWFYKPWWYRYSQKRVQQLDKFTAFLHSASLIERIKAIPATLAMLIHRSKI